MIEWFKIFGLAFAILALGSYALMFFDSATKNATISKHMDGAHPDAPQTYGWLGDLLAAGLCGSLAVTLFVKLVAVALRLWRAG